MKTKFFLASGVLGIALAGVVLNGCHKDSPAIPSTNTDITAAEDDANATFAANDAKTISDAAVQWSSDRYAPVRHRHRGFGDIFGFCATVTGGDTMIGGREDTMVQINFGGSNCFCHDNRDRRGTIIIYWGLTHSGESWLQAYFDSANTITETFSNYYLRDNGIAGTRTWTNEGHDTSGFQNWNFTANLIVTYPDGRRATWSSTRNSAITEVGSVMYYAITGTATGRARTGVQYTLTITSPVYFTVLPWWAGGCPWPEAGSLTITRILTAVASPSVGGTTTPPVVPPPSNTITVNFGTLGTCTPNMYASLDGNRYPFQMW